MTIETANKEYSYIEEGGYNCLEGRKYDYGVLLVAEAHGYFQDDSVYLKLDKAEAKRLGEWLLASVIDGDAK